MCKARDHDSDYSGQHNDRFQASNIGSFKSVQFHSFDADTNEIVVITFGPGWTSPTDNAIVQFAIALYNPDPIINGQHPLFLLDGMRREVSRVVQAIEAECKRLGLC